VSDKKFVLAGVMGYPVAHSRSPVIHNHWIAQYGLRGSYVLLPVQPDQLSDALGGLKALGFAGCNVTIPHKVQAMKAMDWLHPVAKQMGAINTIVVQENGALHGFNNDGFGYIQSIKDAKPNWKASDGPITVLGAGGAARAIVLSLINEGAKEIRLINRTQSKAQGLADEFEQYAASVVKVYDWSERSQALAGVAMLINSTNQGMHGQPELDISLEELPVTALVSDAIYIPLETPLLLSAKKRGNQTVNGLGMLLNQARPAFEAWYGVKPEITAELMRAIAATF
jgi:shikimate dehydrogenase